jgi:hypothetical protein
MREPPYVPLVLSLDQAVAVENALRREIVFMESLQDGHPAMIGAIECRRHAEAALRKLTSASRHVKA